MIIDVHTHLFSETARKDRSRYFDGEPAFKLLYASPKSRMVGARDLIDTMDAEGVDVSVVFGFPWNDPEIYRRENDYILDAVTRFPKRLIGFCCFDAMSEDAPRETERCLNAGLRGVGELAFYESGIDPAGLDALEPIMALCRERGYPVMIHTNEPVGHFYPGKSPNTLAQIYAMVKRFPQNRLILAHWGGGVFFYTLLKREVAETLKNVWYDTAASPFLYRSDLYGLSMGLAGPDKILFGTDYPLLKPSRYFQDMTASGLSDPDKFRIQGENARVLLGI